MLRAKPHDTLLLLHRLPSRAVDTAGDRNPNLTADFRMHFDRSISSISNIEY